MKKKIDIPNDRSNRVTNPGSIILLTATCGESTTISTIAWHMPVSKSPNRIALSISNFGYSLELIHHSRTFCINLPEFSLLQQVRFCGSCSGRDVDKFKETGFTQGRCKKISTFFIEECVAHIECEVSESIDSGDHEIVVGNVLASYIDESLFNKDNVIDLSKISLIHHLGGTFFGILNKEIKEE